MHLIEAAEAFLAQHPQEGYCEQQHSGGVGAAPLAFNVRGWGTWRVQDWPFCMVSAKFAVPMRAVIQCDSPCTSSPLIPLACATQQGFKPVQLEAPESSVGLGGEGSCPSEPGSPVLVGAAAVRLDGVTGEVGWWGSVGC